MPYSLKGKRVLIVGGGSDIAAALATDLLQEGARVTLAGRNIEKTAAAAKAVGDAVRPIALDLSNEESIRAAADQVRAAGGLDHLVSVATERGNGPVASLERRALLAAFDAKVVGPILLAKHFARLIAEEGSLLFFSGLAAWRPSPGLVAMAATNGSVSTLASALAVELAPACQRHLARRDRHQQLGRRGARQAGAVPTRRSLRAGAPCGGSLRRLGCRLRVVDQSVHHRRDPPRRRWSALVLTRQRDTSEEQQQKKEHSP